MTMTHPLAEIAEQLQKAFDAIENGYATDFAEPLNTSEPISHTWFPMVSIEDQEDAFLVKVEDHGLDPDEVVMRIERGMLVLEDIPEQADEDLLSEAGEMEGKPEPEDEANLSSKDLTQGEYVTEIPLPTSIENTAAAATFVEGNLEIYLPKLEKMAVSSS